jgi:hypothetical protein
MPALGDYLGHLLAEITNARLHADLESARIAELYAMHPLLQHMPVPRFRLPNVTLDLVVAVERTDPPRPAPAGDAKLVRKNLDAIVEQALREQKIEPAARLRSALKRNLDAIFDQLRASETSPVALVQATEAATVAVLDMIKAAIPDDTNTKAASDPALESSLRERLRIEFNKLLPLPSPVQVLAVTSQLKDLGFPQNLTRIRLSITEEGVEWAQTRATDAASRTLMPE